MNTPEKIVPTVCVDSNIIVDLYYKYKGNYEDKCAYKKYSRSINNMLDLLLKHKIQMIVPPTVWLEMQLLDTKLNEYFTDFVKRFPFYIVEIDYNEDPKFFDRLDDLIQQYYTPLSFKALQKVVDDSPERIKDISNCIFTWRNNSGIIEPARDAIIMAEATLLKLPLITNNTRDFINDGRNLLIQYINQQNGYRAGIMPYTSISLMQKLGKNQFGFCKKPLSYVPYRSPSKNTSFER